jgi:hypothetical protein
MVAVTFELGPARTVAQANLHVSATGGPGAGPGAAVTHVRLPPTPATVTVKGAGGATFQRHLAAGLVFYGTSNDQCISE